MMSEVLCPGGSRIRGVWALVLVVLWQSGGSQAAAQPAPGTGRRVAVHVASGSRDNPSSATVAVFDGVLDLGPAVRWVRVLFAEARLPLGSAVRVTSLLDGQSQTLDARHLRQWRNGTAFFNGSRVRVELLAGALTRGSSLRVEQVVVGDPSLARKGLGRAICGTDDDREPSNEPAVGRMLDGASGGGCTGSIVDCPDEGNAKCHLSAGHCFFAGSGSHQESEVIQFDVPASGADCGLVHPPTAKQFAIDVDSAVGTNNGPGDDWAVFRVFPNPETGRTTFQEQGDAYSLASAAPATGTVRVTGFGVDGNGDASGGGNDTCAGCLPADGTGQRHQIQQTHSGPIVDQIDSELQHEVDTCGGDSGAPVILESTGEIVAVHTHGGCNSPGGANSATAIDYQPLQDALEKCVPHLLVLLDRTGSMIDIRPSTGNSRCSDALALAVADVQDFFVKYPEVDGASVAVWTFADSSPTDLTGGFGGEAAALSALGGLSPEGCSGSTPLADAICAASDALDQEFEGTPAGKMLAISSDGGENNSSGTCAGPWSISGPPNYDSGSWQQKTKERVVGQNVALTRFWGTVTRSGGFDPETGLVRGPGIADSVFFEDLAQATGGIFQGVEDDAPLPEPFFGAGGPAPAIVPVPTLSAWGALALAASVVGAALVVLRRRRRSLA